MISISIFSIFSTNTPGPFLGILISFSQGEKETVKERERAYISIKTQFLYPTAAEINYTMYSQS